MKNPLLSALAPLFLGLILPLISRAQALPENPPILSVIITSFGSPGDVVTAVWADGTIVWSKDQEDGGPPYLTAKIDPTKTTAFLAKMEKDGVFKMKPADLSHFGPDATYHRLGLIHGKLYIELESWHELGERNPGVLATSTGLHYQVKKEDRQKLIDADEPSYKAFRKLWKEIRDFTTSLIPAKGEPLKEKLVPWPLPGDE